jgi:hypothetical protein
VLPDSNPLCSVSVTGHGEEENSGADHERATGQTFMPPEAGAT